MSVRDTALEKAREGVRLDAAELEALFRETDLITLGVLANGARWRRHPERVVTFVIDRNINYTNICISGCRFCAYYRPPGHAEGFVISRAELDEKIAETIALGGTQILLQGGLHPDLEIDFYTDLLRHIRERFGVHVHGFSPPEILHLSRKSGRPVRAVLETLQAAGLDSVPGGGAEILVDRVRREVSPNKFTAEEWLSVMRDAHAIGLKSSATMMFGHLETDTERIAHLLRIRDLQEETGGFTAFIPWSFQQRHTALSVPPKTAADYLRVLALSRLALDNIPHIQASWVTQGAKIAQTALAFGADDLGSTMIEENVVAAAGVRFRLEMREMVRLVEAAGCRAVQRDCFYRHLKTLSSAAA